MKVKSSYFSLIILSIMIIICIIASIAFYQNKNSNLTANVVKEPKTRFDIYFCPEDMCKEKMITLIDYSTDIKCAFYELNLPDLIEKLKNKNADIVIEDSNSEKAPMFHTGFSEALMHNKFCVFDNHTIATGSMNPTVNDNFLNNNNLLIIESDTLAQNYLDEFSELKNDIYGRGRKVKNPVVYVGDTQIENYFCPDDSCKLHVINAIKKANASVYFMTFSFTDVDIGNLVYNKHYQGLDVKGIFDESQLSDFSRYEELKEFSIIDSNKYKLHDKVFIIDNSTVITGSYNPTQNADKYNDENLLIIHDKAVAKKYIREFLKLYGDNQKTQGGAPDIILSKVIYDPTGGDTGNELVEVKNIGTERVNLQYYYLADNKSSMKLNGTINPGDVQKIIPKFSLKNTDGMLFLKHNSEVIDSVYWEGKWELSASGDLALIRKDTEISSEDAWAVK